MKRQIEAWRGYPSVALLAVVLAMSSACQAQSNKTADVQSVVEAFYGAISAGDADAAMALIAPDAIFAESGNIENYDQYKKNHLPRDIEYESEVKGERGPLKITEEGNTAWVMSTTKYDETAQGNPDLYIITQLMVLTRGADGWKIRSISWSSNQP